MPQRDDPVDRKAFGKRLTSLVERHSGSRYQFEVNYLLPHGTVTPWFSGASLPSADRLVFLARTLGTTTDYLLYGKDSPDDLAERLDTYVRFSLLAAGFTRQELEHHLLDPVGMLENYVEYYRESVTFWQLELKRRAQTRAFQKASKEDWGQFRPPEAVKSHSAAETRAYIDELSKTRDRRFRNPRKRPKS